MFWPNEAPDMLKLLDLISWYLYQFANDGSVVLVFFIKLKYANLFYVLFNFCNNITQIKYLQKSRFDLESF